MIRKKFQYAVMCIGLFLTSNLIAQRGYYDAAYVRYEANEGSLSSANATSRSYKQSDLQSEASGQICVNMSNNNASVEWTVSKTGDGLVVRYSVPDGQSGELDVYANNNFVGTLSLTSNYSWEYLWNNGNPNNGFITNQNPRMRFDEVRMKLPSQIQTGGKLKLVRKSGNIHVDFAELESVPAAVTATGNDLTYNGDGSNLQQFIDQNGGRTIYLPAKTYYVNRELYFGVNDTKLKGAGSWYSQIHFTNNNGGAGGLISNAYGIGYSGLFLTTVRNSRSNSYKGISGVYTGASRITDVWAEHFEVGAWVAQYNTGGPGNADGFVFSHCRFRNNYADGVNLAKGTKNGIVERCSFRNNGDDDMAIWSANGQECQNNTFRYNTAENNWRSSSVAIYGGYNNKAHNLLIKDNVEGGIKVNNAFPGVGFNNNGTHEFYDITVIGCGTFNDIYNAQKGAIDIACFDRGAGTDVKNVKFSNVDIIDSKNDAIFIHKEGGNAISNLTFENIAIDGTAKEYPNNNVNNLNWGRGFGVLITGGPNGGATYCNLTYAGIGGNAADPLGKFDSNNFSWTAFSGCEMRTITTTSPANGASFGGCGSKITIKADATTTNGTVTKVEFFADDVKIGEDNSAPYSFDWNNPASGSHKISTAMTTSSSATKKYAADVNVTVIKTIKGTATAPTIDGTIDAMWNDHGSENLGVKLFGGAKNTGPSDLSANYKATMDGTNIYFLVEVNDDKLVHDSPDSTTWNDDKVEIYIDYGNDKSATYGNNDHSFGFVYGNPIFYYGPGNGVGGKFSIKERTGGYVVEVSVPWSSIGGIPAYGDFIGIEVMVSDDDDGGDRDSKISWNDPTDNAWNKPSVFGTAKLFPNTIKTASICSGGSYSFPDGSSQNNITTSFTQVSKLVGTSGCDSIVETKVTVKTVDVAVTPSGNNITANNAAGSYKWLDCNNNNAVIAGQTAQIFTATKNGKYAVQITEAGCVKTSTCVDVTVTGDSPLMRGELSLFPNPASNSCEVISTLEDISHINVYSIDGVLVKEMNGYNSGAVIDLSNLPSALYTVEVVSKSSATTRLKLQKN